MLCNIFQPLTVRSNINEMCWLAEELTANAFEEIYLSIFLKYIHSLVSNTVEDVT